jgi:4'-phosphopantetheinyl transferase
MPNDLSIPPFGGYASPTPRTMHSPEENFETIDIWRVKLALAPAEREALWSAGLPRAERIRALDSLRVRHARWTARAALRLLIGARLGVSPLDLRIAKAVYGKPLLPDHPQLNFNLSHSGAAAVVALSSIGPVGVDLERERSRTRVLAIARRWLGPSSTQMLEEMTDADCQQAFYRLWTMHEAFAKAVGRGLQMELHKVDYERGPPWPARIAHPDHDALDWRYRPLALEGHAAAVVAIGERWSARLRDASIERLLQLAPSE